MNFKKTIFAAILALGCLNVFAQDKQTEEVFVPHWYLQVQGGGQHTLGEVDFSDLLSPHAQIGVGYNFDKIWGARLSVNAWQSKAGSDFNDVSVVKDAQGNVISRDVVSRNPRWKWNYVAPMVDVTVNLSNLFCGYNPNRVFNAGAFVGVGANVAFNNDEATQVYNDLYKEHLSTDDQFLRYYWEGTKLRLSARAGLTGDFRLSERVSLGLELNTSIVNDHYNSKKAGDKSVDWMFNGLVGLKFNLGKTHASREVKGCDPQIIYKDRIVEKIVEKVVEKPVEKVATAEEPLKETIFYAICVSDPDAENILNKVVAWCNKYPNKTITVDGYADKGTGNAQSNKGYAQKRAEKVAKSLQAKGISADRMTVRSYGDTVQPFSENDKNRCVIIVGQ